MPPEHVASAANAIIGILKQPANDGALTAASAVVVTLAPRLNQEQLTSSGILLVDVLKKNTGYARRVAMDSLVSLAPMLRPELRVQTAEAYLVCIRQLDYAHNFWRGNEKFLALVPYLDSRTQCQAGSEALTFLLSKLALSDGYFETMGTDLNPIRPVIMAIPDARLLATFLKHPVCIGEPREWMLQRFEELVFHNGERVFLPLPKPEPGPSERQGNSENPSRVVPANQPSENQDTEVVEGASDLGGLTSSRSPSSAPVRRFHTVHDAAAWIEHNWPDFDLDATMPVEWHKNP